MFNIPTLPVVSKTLTASTPNVTLYYSSPGGTPRHLVVRTNVRATSGTPNLFMRLNGDSGSNYNIQALQGYSSSTFAWRGTGIAYFSFPDAIVSTANEFSSMETLFPDALSTRSHKSALSFNGRTEDNVRVAAGRWASTAAITSITFYTSAEAFAAGSTFELCVVDESFNIDQDGNGELILGSDGTFTVSSISAADGDLVVIGNLRDASSNYAQVSTYQLNGDSTATNYNVQKLEGAISSVQSSSENNNRFASISGNTAATSVYSPTVTQVTNFSDGSNDRVTTTLYGYHTGTSDTYNASVGARTSRWNNTAAITSYVLPLTYESGSMLSTYAVPKNLITRTELASAAGSVTFSSIPQTYDHLELTLYIRGDSAGQPEAGLANSFNGDTTASNYKRQHLIAYGTTVGAGTGDNLTPVDFPAATATANVFGSVTYTIQNYTKTDRHKHYMVTAGDAGENELRLTSNRWANTAAISSIVFTPSAGNFIAGSVFTLRGISATPSTTNIDDVNGIAIANVQAINGIAIGDVQELNDVENAVAGGGGTSYQGITWSTDDVLPAALGNGIKMGAVGAHGILDGVTKATYEHNGSSWSTTGSSSAIHEVAGGGGTQSAGVVFGGWGGASNDDDTVITEEYNGSTWSTGNNMVTGSAFASGGGTLQTAQLCTGGSQYNPTVRDISVTQTYDGTNWSNESVASSGQGSGGAGESGGGGLDAFLLAGGATESGITAACQIFDQSAGTWTSKATMSLEVRYLTASTDGTRVYKIGGYDPPGFTQTAVVESWVENAWSSENATPAARRAGGKGTGGAEATGGASSMGGADASGATTTYYIAAAS